MALVHCFGSLYRTLSLASELPIFFAIPQLIVTRSLAIAIENPCIIRYTQRSDLLPNGVGVLAMVFVVFNNGDILFCVEIFAHLYRDNA